ncbi:MAG: hypothetical protein AAF412_07245, partial [Pseudomonadota bacterium]
MPHKIAKTVLSTALIVVGFEAHAQTIGKAVRADRTVTGSRSGVLAKNSPVSANERIQANSTGLGHFEFNDGTKMVVGPGTNLVLDQTIYNPNQSSFRKFAIDSTAGALRFISGSSATGTYEIDTPTGTLGKSFHFIARRNGSTRSRTSPRWKIRTVPFVIPGSWLTGL